MGAAQSNQQQRGTNVQQQQAQFNHHHNLYHGGGGAPANSSNLNNNHRTNNNNNFNQQQDNNSSRDLEFYAIRLESEQSIALYGFINPKTTLTFRDVLENAKITLASCIACGVPASKLQRMQPDIKKWIQHGKTTIHDTPHLEPWYCCCYCYCDDDDVLACVYVIILTCVYMTP